MASTAESRGRSKEIARGMVDEELAFTHLLLDGDSLLVNDIEGRKEGKLISLTTEQAIKYKISDGKAETIDELIEILGFSDLQLQENNENWSEVLVRFLTDPVVASLLTTFGFLGILFELQSPGWGIPGLVGLICLVLSLSASYIAQLATMSDMLFIMTGLALIMLEAFVIPGFGIVGISGISIMIYGLYLLLIPDILDSISFSMLGNEMSLISLIFLCNVAVIAFLSSSIRGKETSLISLIFLCNVFVFVCCLILINGKSIVRIFFLSILIISNSFF